MTKLGRVVVVVETCLWLLGCSRKAPGPDECVAFTELLMGVSHETVLRMPRVKAQFDALVVACLTEPFDQRVFTCTNESRSPLVCLKRYQPGLTTDNDVYRNSDRSR